MNGSELQQLDNAALLQVAKDRVSALNSRIRLLTPAELCAIPPQRWRVRGVLPEAGLGAIFGPPSCGKSFLTLDLMGSLAAGSAWFSHAGTASPCVYVGLEGEAGVSQRVRAFTARHGAAGALRVVLTPLDIGLPDDRRELTAVIRSAGMAGGVVAFDTLNRCAPGLDENDSREMGRVITAMKDLQADLGGLVLVVHHSGKESTKGMRGHSSLLAALDVVIEVTRQEDRREWRLVKAKDGLDGQSHSFRLDVVELGIDADGWPVTSCVVVPEEQAGDTVGRARVPRGGNQKVIWDGLGELMRASGHFGRADAPPSRPCVKLDDAIHALRDRLTCPADRQTERTRAAITGLIASGLIHNREGWLWTA